MKSICFTLFGVLGFLLVSTTAGYGADKPNVVILFADDAGYADFGFQPDARPDMAKLTPHIDSIAADGARCSQAYVTGAVCSPSRAGLMTGRYQERFGHELNLPPGFPIGLPLTETFGVKRLQRIGYHTGLIGKWHLGYPEAYQPNRRGYDYFYGLLQGSRSYYPYSDPSPDRVIRHNDTPTREEGYLTDRLGDAACEYIEAHKDESFYLFVSFTAPHGPLEPRQDSVDAERVSHIQDEKRRRYAGLVLALDDNVGKVLATLKQNHLAENTLVIFTNDNGGPSSTGTSNYPLRGHKGNLYEGGVRVPWAMSWPGVIRPGSVIDLPISTLDILPTVFAAAGEAIDPEWQLDGRSMLPVLKDPDAKMPNRALYWRRKGVDGPIALREQNWKLRLSSPRDSNPELYDLATDVGETQNVAADHPDVVARLSAKLQAWESELVTPLWGPGSPGFVAKQKTRKR